MALVQTQNRKASDVESMFGLDLCYVRIPINILTDTLSCFNIHH